MCSNSIKRRKKTCVRQPESSRRRGGKGEEEINLQSRSFLIQPVPSSSWRFRSTDIQILVMNAVDFSSSCLQTKSLVLGGVAVGRASCRSACRRGQRCGMCSSQSKIKSGSFPFKSFRIPVSPKCQSFPLQFSQVSLLSIPVSPKYPSFPLESVPSVRPSRYSQSQVSFLSFPVCPKSRSFPFQSVTSLAPFHFSQSQNSPLLILNAQNSLFSIPTIPKPGSIPS